MHAISRTRGAPAPVSRAVTVVALMLAVAGILASLTAPVTAATRTRNHRIREATSVALRKIGDPYHYGSAGPNRFDCSGLLFFSFHRAGFDHLPRTAAEQARFARRIPRSRLRRGDFMFFTSSSGSVYHVAIFLRWHNHHRVMLHAPEPGRHVTRARPFSNHWFAATLRKR